jgi:hypothetical protein
MDKDMDMDRSTDRNMDRDTDGNLEMGMDMINEAMTILKLSHNNFFAEIRTLLKFLAHRTRLESTTYFCQNF